MLLTRQCLLASVASAVVAIFVGCGGTAVSPTTAGADAASGSGSATGTASTGTAGGTSIGSATGTASGSTTSTDTGASTVGSGASSTGTTTGTSGGTAGVNTTTATGTGGSTGGNGGLDAGAQFPQALYDGLWLVGWSGDLDHYSWYRFDPVPTNAADGSWSTARGRCAGCDCNDTTCASPHGGVFMVLRPDTLALRATGDGGSTTTTYRVRNWAPPTIGNPFRNANVDLTATFEIVNDGGVVSSYQGYRFPSNHCGADLASCPPLY